MSEEIERTETNLSRWAGTPAFVAPECINGESIVICEITCKRDNFAQEVSCLSAKKCHPVTLLCVLKLELFNLAFLLLWSFYIYIVIA